ncbi:hypothetical protein [Roseivirga sp. E12]|uniref:hypothetical protein n=1 Tax=Roseivirga sp. E12 TaxID=2819237 RepID=UPI001ABCAE54|nr:hypothetical protein [Roseivirga sp. E12]MBO3700385.1 hypothetical protein [Roseivirga sp. E12]
MIRYLLLSILVFAIHAAKAQSDTLKVSEEYYKERDPNLILVPSSRLRPLFDESQILKVGIGVQSISGNLANSVNNGNFVSIDLSYERKIKKSPWSITTNIANHSVLRRNSVFHTPLGFYNSTMISVDEWEYTSSAIRFQLDLGVKYYYRQDKRLSRGIGGNNLNGSYFGATLWNGLAQFTEVATRFRNIGGRSVITREAKQEKLSLAAASLYLSWGNQVRILRRAYLDVNIGPAFEVSEPSNWSIIMNLKLGVALWKK